MPDYYAYTRALTPAGDLAFDDARSSWAGGSPMAEVVERVLRTPRGSYLPDPRFGVDFASVQKNTPNAGARFRDAILAALKYLTDARLIVSLTVETEARGAQLLYRITFTDPRQPGARPITVSGVR